MNLLHGRAWIFGDNISADDGIIQYSKVPDLGSFDIPALKEMCFATIRPEFRAGIRPGDFVVAGRNFGHHSHPHACVAMRECGVGACLVESTDSAFVRKALNAGLPVIVCRGITAICQDQDLLTVDMAAGEVLRQSTGERVSFRPFAPQMIEVWQAGGLAAALQKRFENRSAG